MTTLQYEHITQQDYLIRKNIPQTMPLKRLSRKMMRNSNVKPVDPPNIQFPNTTPNNLKQSTQRYTPYNKCVDKSCNGCYVERLEQEIDELVKQLNYGEQCYDKLSEENQDLKNQLLESQKFQISQRKNQNELTELRIQLQDQSSMKNQISQLQGQVNTQANEIDTLVKEIELRDKQIVGMNSLLQEKNEQNARMNELTSLIMKAQNENFQLNNIINQQKGEIDRRGQILQQYQQNADTIKPLMEQINQKDQTISELKKQIELNQQQHRNEIDILRGENQYLQKKVQNVLSNPQSQQKSLAKPQKDQLSHSQNTMFFKEPVFIKEPYILREPVFVKDPLFIKDFEHNFNKQFDDAQVPSLKNSYFDSLALPRFESATAKKERTEFKANNIFRAD